MPFFLGENLIWKLPVWEVKSCHPGEPCGFIHKATARPLRKAFGGLGEIIDRLPVQQVVCGCPVLVSERKLVGARQQQDQANAAAGTDAGVSARAKLRT